MTNVVIVDDEAIVLNGLKNLIPWAQLDSKIIGEFTNGKDALDMILTEHPDIVITDVRMPVMDGLMLCKSIHASLPNTVNIILSAYDDFSYAQSAIKYGVTEYILKPIDRQKINQLINKIREVSVRKKTHANLQNILYGSDFTDNIIKELKQGNSGFFEDFFEKEFAAICSGDENIAMELIHKLLNILFDYVEVIGLNLEVSDISRERAWNRLLLESSINEKTKSLKQYYLNILQFISHKKTSHRDAVIEQVKKYIFQQCTDPDLSVYSIANKLNYSSNYLSNIFAQVTGGNISSYITKVRMEKAIELLKNDLIPVNEVSKSLGYSDPNYFAKVFKRHTGVTPTEYKNLSINSETPKEPL